MKSRAAIPVAFLLLVFAGPALLAQSTRYRDPIFTQVRTQKDIVYGSAVHRYTKATVLLELDFSEPMDQAALRPAVVLVHGGGFVGGDKSNGNLVNIAQLLARSGYVVVSINYRLHPRNQPKGPQMITDAAEDFKAAVRFLRKNEKIWRIDAGQIGALGSSAGGYTVLEGAYGEGEGKSGNPGYSSEVQAVVDLWGGLGDVKKMETGEAPLCIIHGTVDPVVSYNYATALHQQALKVGIPVELHPIAGAGHAPWNTVHTRHMDDIVAFYYEHLKLGQLSGLRAQPGYASPGSLKLHAFGVAGDQRVLALAAAQISFPMGELGVFCLHPSSLLVLPAPAFGSGVRLPSATTSFTVPAGHTGLSVYWQELHLSKSGVLRLFTSCVQTKF